MPRGDDPWSSTHLDILSAFADTDGDAAAGTPRSERGGIRGCVGPSPGSIDGAVAATRFKGGRVDLSLQSETKSGSIVASASSVQLELELNDVAALHRHATSAINRISQQQAALRRFPMACPSCGSMNTPQGTGWGSGDIAVCSGCCNTFAPLSHGLQESDLRVLRVAVKQMQVHAERVQYLEQLLRRVRNNSGSGSSKGFEVPELRAETKAPIKKTQSPTQIVSCRSPTGRWTASSDLGPAAAEAEAGTGEIGATRKPPSEAAPTTAGPRLQSVAVAAACGGEFQGSPKRRPSVPRLSNSPAGKRSEQGTPTRSKTLKPAPCPQVASRLPAASESPRLLSFMDTRDFITDSSTQSEHGMQIRCREASTDVSSEQQAQHSERRPRQISMKTSPVFEREEGEITSASEDDRSGFDSHEVARIVPPLFAIGRSEAATSSVIRETMASTPTIAALSTAGEVAGTGQRAAKIKAGGIRCSAVSGSKVTAVGSGAGDSGVGALLAVDVAAVPPLRISVGATLRCILDTHVSWCLVLIFAAFVMLRWLLQQFLGALARGACIGGEVGDASTGDAASPSAWVAGLSVVGLGILAAVQAAVAFTMFMLARRGLSVSNMLDTVPIGGRHQPAIAFRIGVRHCQLCVVEINVDEAFGVACFILQLALMCFCESWAVYSSLRRRTAMVVIHVAATVMFPTCAHGYFTQLLHWRALGGQRVAGGSHSSSISSCRAVSETPRAANDATASTVLVCIVLGGWATTSWASMTWWQGPASSLCSASTVVNDELSSTSLWSGTFSRHLHGHLPVLASALVLLANVRVAGKARQPAFLPLCAALASISVACCCYRCRHDVLAADVVAPGRALLAPWTPSIYVAFCFVGAWVVLHDFFESL
eukprot:TRINITY_DN9517_c0_g1_i4.p1 TRINITY_DN9517_c0_g1~~TRINITY_DN9517_c0_g1_i4.p1  ORF type:complete len:882 (-),score=145.25 TRINITY_DN9517_c0_g1_i4:159-2804(-)